MQNIEAYHYPPTSWHNLDIGNFNDLETRCKVYVLYIPNCKNRKLYPLCFLLHPWLTYSAHHDPACLIYVLCGQRVGTNPLKL